MRQTIPTLVALVLLSASASARVTPCWQSARATPVFVVTASNVPGMMHVHYEAVLTSLWIGGPPIVSANGNELVITQIASGGVDPIPGMPDHLCQAEDLEIPALPPSRYRAGWTYVTPPWNGPSFPFWGLHFQFDVTDPLPATSCAAANAPVAYVRDHQLSFSDLVTTQPAVFGVPDVAVSGNTITVTEAYDADVDSPEFVTRCHTAVVSLPFAPQPGEHYEVVWMYRNAHFAVRSTAPVQFVGRRHAAR
jgi:hypothetical protein